MRMLLIKTDVTIQDARDVVNLLHQGFAIQRNTDLETVFHFIGLNGNLYNTNRDRCNHFKLEQSDSLDLFHDFHGLEVYSIAWLAFNNLPWNDNLLLTYKKGSNERLIKSDIVETYNNKHSIMTYEYRHISPEFIMNLYKEGSKDIWIFVNYKENKGITMSNRLYIRVLLDDNTIMEDYPVNFRQKYPDIIPRIRAWQPILKYTSSYIGG